MALTEATKEAIHLRSFLTELGFDKLSCVQIFTDNMGSQRLAENPMYHARTKHIHVRHHFVRDVLKNKIITLDHVSTDDMTADILTKGLAKPKHQRFVNLLGLKELSSVKSE